MTGTAEPRAAIIGAGLMGRWHADAVRKIGGRVTVIVDPNEAAREALGRRHPEARLVADLDPMFIARYATAAHVCTPLATHTPIVTALVAAGVHALVEKPFTESAESTGTVLARAETRHVIVCPVHQFLFQDGVRRLLDWRTAIAPLRRVEFSTCSAGAASDDPASLDDLVSEILPHPFSLVSAILRSPVAPANWHFASPAPGELHAVATIQDTAVTIAISAHGRPTENVLRIVGDGGWVSADLFHGFAVRHSPTTTRAAKITRPFVIAGATLQGASANLLRRAIRREPAYPGLRELTAKFYAAVRGDGPPPIAADATLDVATSRDQLVARMRALRRGA